MTWYSRNKEYSSVRRKHGNISIKEKRYPLLGNKFSNDGIPAGRYFSRDYIYPVFHAHRSFESGNWNEIAIWDARYTSNWRFSAFQVNFWRQGCALVLDVRRSVSSKWVSYFRHCEVSLVTEKNSKKESPAEDERRQGESGILKTRRQAGIK